MAKGIPASLVYVTGNAPINLEKKKKILNLIPLRVRGFWQMVFSGGCSSSGTALAPMRS
jgi:hypothetical protein